MISFSFGTHHRKFEFGILKAQINVAGCNTNEIRCYPKMTLYVYRMEMVGMSEAFHITRCENNY